MKSSVTDVTDPAKLSKLARSTSSEAKSMCKLTSLSSARLYSGWISPLVTKTDSQGRGLEGCGWAGERGVRAWHGQAWWSSAPGLDMPIPTFGSPQSSSTQRPRSCKCFDTHVIHSSVEVPGTSTSITSLCVFNHLQPQRFILYFLVQTGM